jgi:hypothetical protein
MRNLPDFSIFGVRTSPKIYSFPQLFPGLVSLGGYGRRDGSPALLVGAGVLSATGGLSGEAGPVKVQQVLRIILSTPLSYTIEHKNLPEKRRFFWQAARKLVFDARPLKGHLISENSRHR